LVISIKNKIVPLQTWDMIKYNFKLQYVFRMEVRHFSSTSVKLMEIDPDKILEQARKQHEEMKLWHQQWNERKLEEQSKKSPELKELLENKKSNKRESSELEKLLEDKKSNKREISGLEKLIEDKKEKLLEEKKANPEKNFLDEAREKIDQLMDKQDLVEKRWEARIVEYYDTFPEKVRQEVFPKFVSHFMNLAETIDKKSLDLENEFPVKTVGYFTKKLDLESAGFKKIMQIREKEENAIIESFKETVEYQNNKEEFDRKFLEVKQERAEEIRGCRQEKQKIKEEITSNLEKPSEIAQDLVDETGPDYTGGDD